MISAFRTRKLVSKYNRAVLHTLPFVVSVLCVRLSLLGCLALSNEILLYRTKWEFVITVPVRLFEGVNKV